jgi:hypothetical protein
MSRWRAVSLVMIVACGGGTGPAGPALARLSVETLDFGAVPVGTSKEIRVQLHNDGGEPLQVLSVTLIDGDSDIWQADRAEEGDVDPGSSVDIVVVFEPEEADDLVDGRAQVRTSDAATGPLQLSFSGTGLPSTVDRDGDGFSPATGDCDEGRADVFPGATELCDGRDNDCDGTTPVSEADGDRDGVRVCGGDCDDGDAAVRPGADEICDDKDSDCDGRTPDRLDEDRDGASICAGDCDDGESSVAPGLVEICDNLDNDCNDEVDDIDQDRDGRSVCRGDCDDRDRKVYSLIVDPSENPPDPDGSETAPFRSVDDALAALDPACPTLWLADGKYEYSFELVGESLTLQGQSRDGVILVPGEGSRVATLSEGASLTLRMLTVTEGAGEGDGGAVVAGFSTVELDEVLLTGNNAGADGGGVAVTSGVLRVRSVEARENAAADDGGALAAFSSTMELEDVVAMGNTANRGGAVVAEGSVVTWRDVWLEGNSARDVGGGGQILGGGPHRVERLTAVQNVAVNGGGGLALSEVAAGAELYNLLLMENEGGTLGGGLSITGSTGAVGVYNATLSGNGATGAGAGVYVGANPAAGVLLQSLIVAWSDGGSGVFVPVGSGARVEHTLVYATSPGADFGGGASALGVGNLNANPQFEVWSDNGRWDDDDVRLKAASPARDAGPLASDWLDRDGSRNDLGVTGGPRATSGGER